MNSSTNTGFGNEARGKEAIQPVDATEIGVRATGRSIEKPARWQDGWCLIRVRVSTRDRLRALKHRRHAAYQVGRTRLDPSQADGISDDAQIADLINRYDRHAERARRHRLYKRSPSAETGKGAAAPVNVEPETRL